MGVVARYIDADKLREYWLVNGVNENVYNTNDVLDSIDYQSTADVEEVKHGEWERIIRNGKPIVSGIPEMICRCENCQFVHFNKDSCTYHCKRRGYFSEEVKPRDFCSYGKRRDT